MGGACEDVASERGSRPTSEKGIWVLYGRFTSQSALRDGIRGATGVDTITQVLVVA